jgi:23S rRNA pseudouridine2605 synthase
METRIQKILSQAGYGSRRSCEELILEERVKVNGKIATLGMKANQDQDQITIDGSPLAASEPLVYVILHKPPGVLSTTMSPDPRPTVRSLIDLPGHLYPVGRLDVNSEGLILMTNDGELANQLTHPRYEHEKEYRVMVTREPTETQLRAWRKGIFLEDGTLTQPAKVWIEAKDRDGTWLGVILKEGKKRQIRRMGQASGLPVKRLIRVRISALELGDLAPGEWRNLSQDEVKQIQELTG